MESAEELSATPKSSVPPSELSDDDEDDPFALVADLTAVVRRIFLPRLQTCNPIWKIWNHHVLVALQCHGSQATVHAGNMEAMVADAEKKLQALM